MFPIELSISLLTRAMVCVLRILLLFVLVDITIAAIFSKSTSKDDKSDTVEVKAKKRGSKKKERSTSSSSGEKIRKDDGESSVKSSLELSVSSSSTDTDEKRHGPGKKKDRKPKSSRERRGWRKWHRKCTPCPEDMRMKWRNPSIKWICGAYQRARRSFKSLCMMHYRNCQDGTMFTKIADHRCQNSSNILNHGDHFFYDYKVVLSGDSSSESKSKSKSSSSSTKEKSSSSESWDSDKFAKLDEIEKNDINVRLESPI